MARPISPPTLPDPLSNYSHAMLVPAGSQLLVCSGQLGARADGTVPEGAGAQAEICFANVRALLAESGMDLSNVVRINAYVTGREHMAPYMEVRNALFPEPWPASTLLIVSGFSRPEFVVEVEVIAAKSA
ncbi:RidA family protein [Aquamicrobium lusatiense]|nr:Rid family hydrolase [Aquamicrobium lusatiense]